MKLRTAANLLCAASVLAFSNWTGAGVVKLTTGEVIEGRLSLIEGTGFRLRLEDGKEKDLRPAEVRQVRFQTTDAVWAERYLKDRNYETGLVGTYFEGIGFDKTYQTRTDARIDFNWGGGGPIPNWRSDQFSVRWVGKLVPPKSGNYKFFTLSDDGVRLWVNGQKIIDKWADQAPAEFSGSIELKENEQTELKLEYYENSGEAVIKLMWDGPGFDKRTSPPESLRPPEPKALEKEWVDLPKIGLKPGVVLRDGTVLVAPVKQANDTAVELGAPFDGLTFSTFNVARIVFREIPESVAAKAVDTRKGALLVGGDFVDGEFKSLERNVLKVSSVLFGFKTLDTKYETLALQLRRPAVENPKYRIITLDGTVVLGEGIDFRRDAIHVTSPVVKGISIPLESLWQVEAGASSEMFPESLLLGPDSVHASTGGKKMDDSQLARQADSLRQLASREKSRAMQNEARLKSTVIAERKAVEAVTDQLSSYRDQLEELEEYYIKLSAAFATAEKEYKKTDADYRKTSSEYSKASSDANRATSDAQRAASRYKQIVSSQRNKESEWRKRLARSSDDKSRKQYKDEMARIEAQVTRDRMAMTVAEKKARETETEKNRLYRRTQELRRDAGIRRSDLDKARRSRDSAKSKVTSMENQIKSVEKQLMAAVEKVENRKKAELR